MTDEATVAIKAKMTTSIVHPIGGTGMRYPSEESISQQKHIQATLSCQSRFYVLFYFHHSGIHTNSTRICANGQQICVTQQDLISHT